MQFTTLSVAFFAALASAHQHNPQHFHHRRQLNGTSGASTTLTVYATSIRTITSCAATITDCPARPAEATHEVVVTEVVPVTTTVCPVENAASVSSAIISSHVISATGKPSAPLGTGSGPAITTAPSGPDTTLTYTLGTGTSTTVVTTTIKHTSTATVYATSKKASTSRKGGEGGAGGTSDEPTTTISGTSTSTKYVTVFPITTGASNGLTGPSAAGSAGCVPVTVTVTQARATVTVTEKASPTGTDDTADDTTDDHPAVTSAKNGAPNTAVPSKAVIIQSTATVVPVPVASPSAPYGNGTYPISHTKKPCSSVFPSGFISKTKSAYPTGY